MVDWRREYLDLVKALWRAYNVYSSAGATNAAFDRHIWPVIADARRKLREDPQDKDVLLVLAKKLEQADTGSRELDLEIAEALHLMEAEAMRPFTTSIDAALMLTDRSLYDYQLGDVNGHVGGTPFAQIGQHTCYGATPALALCAASLTVYASDSTDP